MKKRTCVIKKKKNIKHHRNEDNSVICTYSDLGDKTRQMWLFLFFLSRLDKRYMSANGEKITFPMGQSLILFGAQRMFITAWCSGAVSVCTRQWFEHTLCYHLATFHIPTWQSTVRHTTTTANMTYSCFAHLQTRTLRRKYYLQAETGKEREPLQTYKESPTGQACLQ